MRIIRASRTALALLSTGILMLALGVPAMAANAGPDLGVRGGAYSDEEDPFLGAEVLFNVGTTKRWFGNPNLEHTFADAGDLTTVSFDMHYDFVTGEPYTVWAGAGPTILFRDTDRFGDDHDTDAGLNLLVGVGAQKGDVRPYGQMKFIVADDNQAVVAAGVRF